LHETGAHTLAQPSQAIEDDASGISRSHTKVVRDFLRPGLVEVAQPDRTLLAVGQGASEWWVLWLAAAC
jgi:hypothetical protein